MALAPFIRFGQHERRMIGSRLEFVKLDLKPNPWPFSPEGDHTAQSIAAEVECQILKGIFLLRPRAISALFNECNYE